MSNFSIIGFVVFIALVFLFLKWSNGLTVKDGGEKDTNSKLIWVAVIACLTFLGLTVVMGDWG